MQYDKKNSVVVSSNEETLDKTDEGTDPRGRPGTGSNTNTGASVAAGSSASSIESMTDTRTRTLPSVDETRTEEAGLMPKRITVSVGIPKSYFEKVWRQRNNITDPEQTPDEAAITVIERSEISKMRTHIALLLPVKLETDPVDLVDIMTFEDIPVAEIPEPGLGADAMVWLGQYWSTLGMTFLGLFSLLMLRSMVRSAPVETAAASARPADESHASQEEEEEESDEETVDRVLKLRESTGRSLRDELADVVREDPNAAASILRSWIGNAS